MKREINWPDTPYIEDIDKRWTQEQAGAFVLERTGKACVFTEEPLIRQAAAYCALEPHRPVFEEAAADLLRQIRRRYGSAAKPSLICIVVRLQSAHVRMDVATKFSLCALLQARGVPYTVGSRILQAIDAHAEHVSILVVEQAPNSSSVYVKLLPQYFPLPNVLIL